MTLTKDLVSGTIFAAVGIFVVIEAQNHPMGTLLRMGPGYYPTLVGALAIIVGLALVAKDLLKGGVPVPRIAVKELVLLIGSIVIFALTLERLGLVISTVLLVVLSRLARRPYRPVSTLILAAALVLVGIVIFWWFLQLPIPLWP